MSDSHAFAPALAYMVTSGSLSLLNRYILHTRDPPFPYSSLLITIQAVVMGALTFGGLQGRWYEECCMSSYWPTRLTFQAVGRLLVFEVTYAGDVLLTQQSLVLAPPSFVEVVKCAVPVVIVVEMAAMQFTRPGVLETSFVILISIGVGLASGGEGLNYEVEPGAIFVSMAATLVAGTRLVYMQVLLQGDRRCPLPLLLMYFSPTLFLTGIITFIVKDLHSVPGTLQALSLQHILWTLVLLTASALLACALNYSEFWCVRVTSALLLTIVGAVKTVLLVLLSTLLSRHWLTFNALLGSTLAIGGAAGMKLYKDRVTTVCPVADSPQLIDVG